MKKWEQDFWWWVEDAIYKHLRVKYRDDWLSRLFERWH